MRGGAAAGTSVDPSAAAVAPVDALAATGDDAENVNLGAEASATTTAKEEAAAATAPAPVAPPGPLQQQQPQQRAFAAQGILKRKGFNAPSALLAGGGGAGRAATTLLTAKKQATTTTTTAAAAASTSTAAPTAAASSSSSATQVYRILYCKRSSKKRINKSFSDAILEVKGDSSITLYDDEGKRFAAGKLKGARDMPKGADGECGQWEFEVCERVDAAALASGALFLRPVPAGLAAGAAGDGNGGGSGGGGTETAATTTATSMATTTTFASRAPLGARKGLSSSKSSAAAAAAAAASVPRVLPPPLFDPKAPGAIVLNEAAAASGGQVAVVVDPFLARRLRPHQAEALLWLYERIALPAISSSSSASFGGVGAISAAAASAAAASAAAAANRAGAILSHEPGLGKTLTALALVHTLHRQSPRGGKGLIRRVVVACPASLCDNWAAEVQKWLGAERLRCLVLRRGSGAEAASDVGAFRAGVATPLLIASYETLRAVAPGLAGSVDLLICDEGHRLKASAGSRTQAALLSLRSPRMLLLTGTPLQNDLSELFALVDFACPGALGSLRLFQTLFEVPIQRSRDARASDREREVGERRAAELATRVGSIVLRRSASMNAAYLPPLTVYDVFLKLTDAQVRAYRAVLGGSGVASVLRSVVHGGGGNGGNGGGGSAGTTTVLPLIGLLRKICISPKLVSSSAKGGQGGGDDDDVDRETTTTTNDDEKSNNKASLRAASAAAAASSWRDSTKLVALDALLRAAASRGDKVIVTSTSTAVLDVAGLVAEGAGMTTARIDGATDARARIDVVNAFNNVSSTSAVPGSRGGDVMLLSMRAGGAGLNLIGAPVLVTLDFDWNPATIAQVRERRKEREKEREREWSKE
jgi:DNA repair and recombination protein RAD54B